MLKYKSFIFFCSPRYTSSQIIHLPLQILLEKNSVQLWSENAFNRYFTLDIIDYNTYMYI